MPIGGLKEKLLAAHRSGISLVIIPKENRKDLREVPRRVLKATRIVLVEHMDEVLREALCLPSPDALFGPKRDTMEYVDGELVVSPVNIVKGRTSDGPPSHSTARSRPRTGAGQRLNLGLEPGIERKSWSRRGIWLD